MILLKNFNLFIWTNKIKYINRKILFYKMLTFIHILALLRNQ